MSFDISRLRRADQIVGGGAIALFIFMFFFKWYGGSSSSSVGGVSFSASSNGWHTFTDSRWIWLLTIIVALGMVVLELRQQKLELPVKLSVIVAGLGALSTLLILYRIIHHPSGSASSSFGTAHVSYSYGIKIGIWLGLIAAAAIAYGAYLAMQAEGTSIADVREQASSAFSGLSASPAGGGTAASPSPAEPAGAPASGPGAAPTSSAAGAPAVAPPIPPPVTPLAEEPAGEQAPGEPPPPA
jgi:hypothetical protein